MGVSILLFNPFLRHGHYRELSSLDNSYYDFILSFWCPA
jgi:hypothetical protein